MILRKLRLRRFGRLTDGEWEFADGLTVIRGPNEAGKSTMREGIVRLLLPDKKVDTQDSSYMALASWGSDERFALSCEFEAAGDSYDLVRDFEAERVELTCAGTGETLTDEPAVAERMWELLGVSSRAVYETTACLAQQEFVRLEEGERVAELLQQTVVGAGAETGAQNVLGELDSQIGKLSRGLERHAKNPGAVRATLDRIEELDQEITRLRPIVQRATDAADRMERARERMSEIEDQLQQATRIRERAQQRRKLEEQLSAVNEEFRALDARAREARQLKERIEQIDEKLDDLPDVDREQVEELAKLIDAAELAAERVPEADQDVAGAEEKLEAAQQQLQSAQEGAPDEGALERLRELDREVEEAEEDLEQAQAVVERAEEDLTASREAKRGQRSWLVAAGVLIVAGIGLALGLGRLWPTLIAAAGIVVGIMGFQRGPRMAPEEAERRRDEAEAAADEVREQLESAREERGELLERVGAADTEALEREFREAQESIDRARQAHTDAAAVARTTREDAEKARQQAEITQARLDHRLEQLGADSAEDFLTTAREVFELREQREALRAQRKGVLGDQEVAEIQDKITELAGDRLGLRQELETEEMASATLDAESFEELQSRIERLESEREQLREEIDAARGPADHPESDPEHLRRLQEQRAEAERRLERVRERLDALKLAHELLEQAHEETLEGAIEVLEPRTSELLAGITDGRYCAVQFNRTTLEPSVLSPEKGEAVDPDDELSCATREQVYLAARLALTELLWPEECPPIILDDPFVNFDPQRRTEAVGVIRRLAEGRQVLLFTCEQHYDAAADRVVELPGPGV